MTAAWAGSIVAMISCAGAISTLAWRGGRRDGELAEILRQPTQMTADHEARLRTIERYRP